MNPVFADYMEAYGRGGVKAHAIGPDALQNLTRLYWYTVEFGLIDTPEGLRIYGAGIVSSKGESRSEEHTSELQSQSNLVCRLLLEKKKKNTARQPPDRQPRTRPPQLAQLPQEHRERASRSHHRHGRRENANAQAPLHAPRSRCSV